MKMTGADLKAIRDMRGETQAQLAAHLNGLLGRNYAANKISKWESGHEPIPQNVVLVLRGVTDDTRSRRAYVLAVANQKGGVGKTVSAVNLAWAVAAMGYRTLLVDADPQGNATVHLGLQPPVLVEDKKTLYNVLLEDVGVGEVIVNVGDNGEPLDIIPSGIDLAAADAQLMAEPNGGMVLRDVLRTVLGSYDVIIIDTPPHLGLLTINALSAADGVLIPVQTEPFATIGIPLLESTIAKTRRRGNPDLRIFGILPTMANLQLTQDRETLEELEEDYGGQYRIFRPVLRATVYAKSTASGRPLLAIDPKARGVSAYVDLARALAAEIQEAPNAA